jgi:bifunctional non-homologous end joining protein LigD
MTDDVKEAKSVTLYNTKDGADKVYQASLRAVDNDLWIVEYAHGKRGRTLKTGLKFEAPVDFKTANAEYKKLVASKRSGGYVNDQSGVAYTEAESGEEFSGVLPQLPIALDDEDVVKLINDDQWWLQQKRDGQNRLLQIRHGVVRGINRKGNFCSIPQDWADYLSVLPDCLIAGEACGNLFYAFDLLERHQTDLRDLNFHSRFAALDRLIALTFKWHDGTEEQALANRAETEKRFRIIPAHSRAELKQKEFDRLKAEGEEGVVFKKVYETFSSGKSLSCRKFKFVESATCIVLKLNRQRSVEVGCVNEQGVMESLGNVTIPANYSVPAVDDLVEVRYLYRFEASCLEQPVYLGVRTDLDKSDAVTTQIKRIKARSASAA